MDYYSNFEDCVLSMIDSIKRILYDRHKDIFNRLDFYNDEVFMEPLLYSYVHQDDPKWLDSIIYGYETDRKEIIEVFSNSNGIVYIPQIGYFVTEFKSAVFQLNYNDNAYILQSGGQMVDYEFESLTFSSENIEILKHTHPLLENFFLGPNDSIAADLITKDLYKSHIDNFERGLVLLKIANPSHYSLLQICLKKVLFFSSAYPNSFAVLAAHNMVFLNVNYWDTEVFFVDHLSHEGAHVTFNTLTYESKLSLFKYHYNTTFAVASGIPTEHSNLYLRFHGLFTFVEITKSLINCLSIPHLSPRSLHETKGRLGFQIRRFKNSLKSFEKLNVFQESGLEWYSYFVNVYNELEEAHGHLTNHFDFSDQSYDFNSEVFFSINPL